MRTSEEATWTFCPDPALQINSVALSDDASLCVFGTYCERQSGQFTTYLYNGNGQLLWQKPVSSEETYEGVYWVDISSNGCYVASGGALNKTTGSGYLRAYMADTGQELLAVETSSRINQVSLSWDGRYLAACYGNTVDLYWFDPYILKYELIFTTTSDTYEINSCMISRDGSRLVASGINYYTAQTSATATPPARNVNTSDSLTKGCVFSYQVSEKQVTHSDHSEMPTGSMRVAVVDSGNYWATALHTGGCMLFESQQPMECLWQETPTKSGLELAYALAITETASGQVYVACGANLNSTVATEGGYLYVLESINVNGQQKPNLKFSTNTKRGVNPGVALDMDANYVTACDGKPVGQTPVESLGSFYLFNVQTQSQVWQYPTRKMNWAMTLNRSGSVVFGGSDDGSVYYWRLV